MATTSQSAAKAFINMYFPGAIGKRYDGNFNAEEDKETIFNNLSFAERIFPDRGLMLCPLSHNSLRYFSQNCVEILGHSHAALIQMSIPDIFSNVHPEDLPPVELCLNFIKQLEPYDPELFRFALHYRFKNSSQQYAWIKNEKIAIKMQSNNYLHLDMFSQVPDQGNFYKVKLDVSKRSNGKFVTVYTYNPKQQPSARHHTTTCSRIIQS
jgi:hypothetical protein